MGQPMFRSPGPAPNLSAVVPNSPLPRCAHPRATRGRVLPRDGAAATQGSPGCKATPAQPSAAGIARNEPHEIAGA